MDNQEFYKDQYDKSLALKTELNNSLSTPIGILTALLAGLYFCATNFDYDDAAWLTGLFCGIAVLTATMLVFAIIRLIQAFSDFTNGREYVTLNDADTLNNYYTALVAFYTQHPPVSPATVESQSQKDFEDYLSGEMIRNAARNQRNNREKTGRLFQSHKFMIYALISLSLLIVPFGIDFGLHRGKEKVQKVQIEPALPVDVTLKYQKDTTIRLFIKHRHHGKTPAKHSKTRTSALTGCP